MSYRICKKCHENKSLDKFTKRGNSGYQSWCKDCMRTYQRNHHSKPRRRWLEIPENKLKHNQSSARYYERNKDRILLLVSRRQRSNLSQHRINEQNRRAKKKINGGKVTINEWNQLLAFYKYKCLCCGRSDVKLTQDHILPISKGGQHSIDNLQPLCKTCNCKKGTKYIDFRCTDD